MGTSASFARKALSCLAAALLASTLVPASAFAWEEELIANLSVEEAQEAESARADEATGASTEADDSTSADSSVEAGTLAASLMGRPASFVNADVVLDGEPVIGSFTVDGLTFAVIDGSTVELVGVSNPEASDSTSAGSATEADDPVLMLPESVAYNDAEYAVTSIGAYAFYLSGVTSVELPASIANVDDRAFRSSDIASVTVAEGNPSYSSFDGALYSADRSSLLLIPEGKQGAVLLPKETEVAEAGKFSHCSLVDAISAEDGAAFASENGLLYTADLTTLLRVPTGATEITIREGCAAIAAGAMEGCAKLTTINAPASVTSISPDVFTSVPTVSLPAATLAEDAPQLTAIVALASTDDDLPELNVSSIVVVLPCDADCQIWREASFVDVRADNGSSSGLVADASIGEASSMLAAPSDGAGQGWIGPYDQVYFLTPDGASGSWTGQAGRMNPVGGYTRARLRLYNGRVYQMFDGQAGSLYQVGLNSSIAGVTKLEYTLDGRTYTEVPASSTYTSLIDWTSSGRRMYFVLNGARPVSYLTFDNCGGVGETDRVSAPYGSPLPSVADSVPNRTGYRFLGWFTSANGGDQFYDEDGQSVLGNWDGIQDDMTLYAQWGRVDYDLGFDTSSEPGDEDYPGIEKPDETVSVDDGPTVIEDPKRPGYVFQGWTIPNAEGTEAIDQDLVYQDEADGKWYVDASKLPDYADDSGRVELTARWTSVISVDVPSAVTFYADVVTEGQESREGAASSAFGQNKVASQSEVDLRIVGLESNAVETQGSTLGADSILKKAMSVTPSSSTQKLFSLYPTDKALTPDDLQDPDAVSAAKPADAVDFALDDILLEKSFAAEKFTIPAGDTLNLGYRLNLSETGTELDYDKLSTLDEGQSASIANISYCFAKVAPSTFWTQDDDGRILSTAAIKQDADKVAAGDSLSIEKYTRWMVEDHPFYVRWFDKGVTEGNATSESQSSIYQVRIIGINYDECADGSGKAGLTFQFVGLLDATYRFNSTLTNTGGWGSSELRSQMNEGAIWQQAPDDLVSNIIEVRKRYRDRGNQSGMTIKSDSLDKLFLASQAEMMVSSSISGWSTYVSERPDGATGPYGYYAQLGVSNSNYSAFIKQPNSSIVSGRAWWTRSPRPDNATSFIVECNSNGTPNFGNTGGNATTSWYVCPAFCL